MCTDSPVPHAVFKHALPFEELFSQNGTAITIEQIFSQKLKISPSEYCCALTVPFLMQCSSTPSHLRLWQLNNFSHFSQIKNFSDQEVFTSFQTIHGSWRIQRCLRHILILCELSITLFPQISKPKSGGDCACHIQIRLQLYTLDMSQAHGLGHFIVASGLTRRFFIHHRHCISGSPISQSTIFPDIPLRACVCLRVCVSAYLCVSVCACPCVCVFMYVSRPPLMSRIWCGILSWLHFLDIFFDAPP